MKELADTFWQAFLDEQALRLARARVDIDGASDTLFDDAQAAAYDRLHQEFDTLHGAARAVDCHCMEGLYRCLAGLARALRRAGSPLSAAWREPFLQGVAVGERCRKRPQCTVDEHCMNAKRLTNTIRQAMQSLPDDAREEDDA
ncbi:MAG: hypothetical protein PHQ14_05110 [Chromatiales bacterium]|jgi:hypothetical protein|nr:hypothetical protein [Chromatiales bacterium]MDX9766115.1 hypothetical protein [Ectothiorhodospiraceae bacterium]